MKKSLVLIALLIILSGCALGVIRDKNQGGLEKW